MPRGSHVACWKPSSGGVDQSVVATWHSLPRQHRYCYGNSNVTYNGKCNGDGYENVLVTVTVVASVTVMVTV